MHSFITFAVTFLPFLALTILAFVASIRARRIYLPTSITTQVLAIILPFLTNATLFVVTKVSPRPMLRLTGKASSASCIRFTLPSREIAITGLFILDTILITLASTALSNPTLTCGLESLWQQLFIAKDRRTIQAIQDSLECCGFRTVRDKAWPFPAKGVDAEECIKRSGWDKPCEGTWTAEGRSVLGMIIGVGVGVVVIKIIYLLTMSVRPEWFHSERGQGDFGRLSEGRIMEEEGEDEEGGGGGRFLDEPERTASSSRMMNGREQGERLSNAS